MDLKASVKSKLIKEKALELGFCDCGIAKADVLSDQEPRLKEWLSNKRHGEMGYMANNVEKRLDPGLLVDNARSVVVVLLNYYPSNKQKDPEVPVIAKYAYGKDYHFVVKDRLKALMEFIQKEIGEVNGRMFVDSAPVMEHAWAQRAGLGWIGKNSLLLTRNHGSYLFIGELILDEELAYDQPFDKDYCGKCDKCIQACPTGAIVKPHVVDGSRCISYFTIEKKGDIPREMKGLFQNRVFGCDICQDVCPWNTKAIPHRITEFEANPELLELSRDEWESMDHESYLRIFKNSAVKRTKYKGLKRNMDFLKD